MKKPINRTTNKMLLSVIIPIYNTERTLDRCVESVLTQGIEDMEVILIDDGSPDGSALICDSWKKKDKRIRVTHKDNGGLSSARNAGIDIARGEYITFVDSDDYLSPNTYPPLLQQLTKHRNIDIIEFSIDDHGAGRHYLTYEDKIYGSSKDYWLSTRAWNHAYACNKIIRRRLLDGLRFEEGKLYEDLLLYPHLMKRNPCVATTSRGTYNYILNDNGISGKPSKHGIRQLLIAEWKAAILMRTHPLQRDGWQLYLAMIYRIVDLIKLQ